MKKPTPDNQGGARAGAGRPTNASKGLEVLQRKDIRLNQAELAHLYATAAATRTKFNDVVRALVVKDMKVGRKKTGE